MTWLEVDDRDHHAAARGAVTAMLLRESLSQSTEDYLKAIYRLSDGDAPVSTTDIADQLGVAPASVSSMIKRLSEQGWLEHVPYRGVSLTESGRRIALGMVRRHRIIETYLEARLGYSWDAVHDEAERLEHAVTDTLVERMAAALGNPTVDPHGDPIPDRDGRITQSDLAPLGRVPIGEVIVIRRVTTGDDARLRFISESGLVPGTRLRVRSQQPFNGPLVLDLGGRDQVVAADLANLIWCSRES
jgi:DtxR family transcriptional regulator, Mn-dependent transcriptional regulator